MVNIRNNKPDMCEMLAIEKIVQRKTSLFIYLDIILICFGAM